MVDETQIIFDPTTPDFDDILLTLQHRLQQEETWDDLLTAGTGETLTEFIASVGAFSQESIERATQEVMLDTALLPSSIYRITRLLGVHILRKRPSFGNCRLLRADNGPGSLPQLVIPAYTQFTIQTESFFNRLPFIFNSGLISADGVLYQGVIQTETFISQGTPFQFIRIGPQDFSVSDDDLVCYVGGNRQLFTKTTRGLWHYEETSTRFYENTLPTGQVETIFGNDVYGSMPLNGAALEFHYVVTKGSAFSRDDNNVTIHCKDFPDINGKTLSGFSQGDDERNPEFYKIMAPGIYSAKERAVTRDDHRAIAVDYPGVIDAIFQGQAEVNPGDLRWMNIVTAFLLTRTEWTDTQFKTFADYMAKQRAIATTIVRRGVARDLTIDVDLEIFCFNRVDLNTARALATASLVELFRPKLGTIGKSVYTSDIEKTLFSIKDSTGRLIDYIIINAPTESAIVRSTDYVKLGNLSVVANYANRHILTIQG